MKKILMTLALAMAGGFSINAGTLIDFFNNNVRPVATMIMDAPAEEIEKEGLKSITTAMLSEEVADKISQEIKFAEPVTMFLNSNEGGNVVKAWILPSGAETEAFLLIKSPQTNIVIIMIGDENSISEAVQE